MSQHGIETIKIENFKCFENLEINGFKRVNLIGGKNNVGKTALLEAVELLVTSTSAKLLCMNTFSTLQRRQQSEANKVIMNLFFDSNILLRVSSRSLNYDIVIELTPTEIAYLVKDEKEIIKRSTPYPKAMLFIEKDELKGVFVQASRLKDQDIAILYGYVSESNNEDFLQRSLNQFDSNIELFKIIPKEDQVVPKVKVKNHKTLIDLNTLGEGVNRYIAILCAIWASQDGYLFIDEIENGIHYTNYPKLWELIFLASAQANCQVFVTSHSKECITAFNNTQLLENNKDSGAYFELFYSQKKQRISAAYRDAEQLKYALDHNEDIRGE